MCLNVDDCELKVIGRHDCSVAAGANGWCQFIRGKASKQDICDLQLQIIEKRHFFCADG